MVSEVIICNLTTNMILTLNRNTSQFLLDDNSPDWGDIDASDNTYPLLSSKIGVGVIDTSLYVPRQVSIIGWLFNDSLNTIFEKKLFLNAFCNPLDSIKIICGKYVIYGHFSKAITYASKDNENNDCICKFMLNITCPFPLFTEEVGDSQDQSELLKEFCFPLSLPSQPEFVFGYKTRTNVISINNTGTVKTGLIMELRTASALQGITFMLGSQRFALKSDFTLLPGKLVKINTIAGSRGIWYGNDGVDIPKDFSILDLSSDWLQVPVGLSNISITCDSGSVTALDVIVSFKLLYYAMEEQ